MTGRSNQSLTIRVDKDEMDRNLISGTEVVAETLACDYTHALLFYKESPMNRFSITASFVSWCLLTGAVVAQPTTQPATSAPAGLEDPTVLAKVGEQTITRGQVRKILSTSGVPTEKWEDNQSKALGFLIYDTLRAQYVKNHKEAVDDKKFEAFFQEMLEKAKAQGINVEAKLAEQGLTLADIKKKEHEGFAFASALEPQLKEENVAKVAKEIAPYVNGQAIQMRHLVIAASPVDDARKLAAAKKHIEEIKADILAKKITFEDAVRTYSDDENTLDKGGQFPELRFEQIAPQVLPLAEAAFAAKLGEVTGPVRTPFGYHLLLVENKTPPATQPASQPTLENMARVIIRQNAKEMVIMETADKYPVWVEGYTPATFPNRNLVKPTSAPASMPTK